MIDPFDKEEVKRFIFLRSKIFYYSQIFFQMMFREGHDDKNTVKTGYQWLQKGLI